MELRLTDTTSNSYWDNNGAYEKEYNKLYETLVPSSGVSPTHHGELVRCISKIYYDFYNNGFCNVLDSEYTKEWETIECSSCNGSGTFEEYDDDTDDYIEVECGDCHGDGYWDVDDDIYVETIITPRFKIMFDYLRNVNEIQEELSALEKIITSEAYHFDEEDTYDVNIKEILNRIVDKVVFYCLTTENKPRYETLIQRDIFFTIPDAPTIFSPKDIILDGEKTIIKSFSSVSSPHDKVFKVLAEVDIAEYNDTIISEFKNLKARYNTLELNVEFEDIR